MLAALNRWFAATLFVLAAALFGFGVRFGFFAWINDGPRAGLGVFGISAVFAGALAASGAAMRCAAAAHSRRAPRRWWIQAAVSVVVYVAIGLAAETMELLDRVLRQ